MVRSEHKCVRCKRVRKVAKWLGADAVCNSCYRHVVQKPCADCGQTRGVAQRIEGKPICHLCYRKRRTGICIDCGKMRPVEYKQPNGEPVCKPCVRARKPHRHMRHYKQNAKDRGHIFELSFEQFVGLTSQPCFYCGFKADRRLNGVDRKDNTVGYIYDNCVPCCGKCNHMKGKLDFANFLQSVENIARHLKLC